MDSTNSDVVYIDNMTDPIEEEMVPEPIVEKPKRTYTRKAKVKSELEQAKEDLEDSPYLDVDENNVGYCPECGWEGSIHDGHETKCHICYNERYINMRKLKDG